MRPLPISTNVAKSWSGLHNKGGIIVGLVNIYIVLECVCVCVCVVSVYVCVCA